jgi:hypothetical protein
LITRASNSALAISVGSPPEHRPQSVPLQPDVVLKHERLRVRVKRVVGLRLPRGERRQHLVDAVLEEERPPGALDQLLQFRNDRDARLAGWQQPR